MRLIVAGGRRFKGSSEHYLWLTNIWVKHGVREIVSGCCEGADKFGETFAELHGIPVKPFPADWYPDGKTLDRSAGPRRNGQMVNYADALAVFPGGTGTADVLKKAKRKGLRIFTYGEPA